MKIIFFTQEDPFYVKIFFDEFFKNYEMLDEIKAVVISRTMGKKSIYNFARQMLNFYGLYDFSKIGAKYSYAKIMGTKSVQKNMSLIVPKTYTIKQLVGYYGVDVIERSDLNSSSFQQIIQPHKANLFISVASPIIWKKKLIQMPSNACINIHSAPLPNYRGMMPNFWQMFHGEEEIGITIHLIDVGIDTGDIVIQKKIFIKPEDSLDKLMKRTKRVGAHIMIEAIEQFKSGTVKFKKMSGKGSYYSFPSSENVREFKKMDKRLI